MMDLTKERHSGEACLQDRESKLWRILNFAKISAEKQRSCLDQSIRALAKTCPKPPDGPFIDPCINKVPSSCWLQGKREKLNQGGGGWNLPVPQLALETRDYEKQKPAIICTFPWKSVP